MTTSSVAARIGSQRPRLHSCPPYFSSLGQDAIDLAEFAGLHLDDWQKYVIEETSGLNRRGKYAAFEVGLIVPRQNGKGAIIEADQLKSLFLTRDEQIIYSAHQFKTAKAMFRRIKKLCEECPDLNKQVKAYRQSNEETGIELRSGGRLNFFARSDGSGRGFSAPKMYFDEAYNLSTELIGDMLPTLSAMDSPQIWYASSAGKVASEQLRKIRSDGIRGGGRLAFFEWSAEDGADLDDEDVWYEANPALGIRLDADFVRDVERARMHDEEFARERLGLWAGTTQPVIDLTTWQKLADPEAFADGEVAYGIDVSPNRDRASIGMAGWTPEGRLLVEFVEGRNSADWAVAVAERIHAKQQPRSIVVDGMSPAASWVTRLTEAGLPIVVTGSREYATACGRFYDEAMGGLLAHLDQPALNVALSKAGKRPIGSEGAWGWNRKTADADITPLVAVTLAIHGLSAEPKNMPKRLSSLYAF